MLNIIPTRLTSTVFILHDKIYVIWKNNFIKNGTDNENMVKRS